MSARALVKWTRFALIASLIAYGPSALAHATSTGLATLDLREPTAHYALSLPLNELDAAARGTLTRASSGDQAAASEVAGWLRTRVALTLGGHACPWSRIRLQASSVDATRVSVLAEARCPLGAPNAVLRDQLSAQWGEHYRSIVSVTDATGLRSEHVLDHKTPEIALTAGQAPSGRALTLLGIEHILSGLDHLLFVVVLVLAALAQTGAQTTVNGVTDATTPSATALLRRIARYITAFTLAHSLSLAFATLGWVSAPARIIEPLIAASIIWVAFGAWRALRAPQRQSLRQPSASAQPLWQQASVAFAFGLVHGLAFAEALTQLQLRGVALLWALFSFNVGVEVGQLLVLLIAVPTLLRLRRGILGQRGARTLQWCALLAMAAGAVWLVQRLVA